MSTQSYAPISIQHVNLVTPRGTLHLAEEFYNEVIGFEIDAVPQLQKDILRWFRIGGGPQQIHMAYERLADAPDPFPISSRHACFALPSTEALLALQTRIWEHKQKGGKAAAMTCDEPGKEDSGMKGVEYPTRFFARDYAGNGLEFSCPH